MVRSPLIQLSRAAFRPAPVLRQSFIPLRYKTTTTTPDVPPEHVPAGVKEDVQVPRTVSGGRPLSLVGKLFDRLEELSESYEDAPYDPSIDKKAYTPLEIRNNENGEPLVKIRSEPAPHTGSIYTFTLNRPSKKNAISKDLVESLSAAFMYLDIFDAEDCPEGARAVIIESSAEGAFCAGADLSERASMTIEETKFFLVRLRALLHAIELYPIPIIAAIDGLALGGGLELALASHLRICTTRSEMGLPESRIGIIPGAGGTYRLRRLVNPATAAELLLTGRRVKADEAQRIGLVNTVTDGSAVEEARRLAKTICEGAPLAINYILHTYTLRASERTENRVYDLVLRTEDREEGLKAFQEKRKPVFTGAYKEGQALTSNEQAAFMRKNLHVSSLEAQEHEKATKLEGIRRVRNEEKMKRHEIRAKRHEIQQAALAIVEASIKS